MRIGPAVAALYDVGEQTGAVVAERTWAIKCVQTFVNGRKCSGVWIDPAHERMLLLALVDAPSIAPLFGLKVPDPRIEPTMPLESAA